MRTGRQRVWINGYEWGCCGEPFDVGSTVRFVVSSPTKQWLSRLLGEAAAPTIDACEERHGSDDGDLFAVEGAVRSIDAVFCRYGPHPDYTDGLQSVAGSGILRRRTDTPRFPADEGDREFIGYVVDLEVIKVTAART